MNQTRYRFRCLAAALGLVVVASMVAAVPVARLAVAQSATPAAEAGAAGVTTEPWGEVEGEEVTLYTLTNTNGMEVKITNYVASSHRSSCPIAMAIWQT
jgi:hypothetical protein